MKMRILSVILSAVLVLSGVAGAVAESNPQTVSWFSDVSFWAAPVNWDTTQYVIKTITEKTGALVEFNIPAQDGDTKLNLMMVSGKLPDMMTITNSDMWYQLISAGLVWDMGEFLKTYAPDAEILTTFPEDLKNALIARDGGWYAYPSHMSTEDARKSWPASSQYYLDGIYYRNNGALMFNGQIMEELGITLDSLKTEAGVLEAFAKVKAANLTVDGASVYTLLVDGQNFKNNTVDWVLANNFGAMPVDGSGVYRDPMYAPAYKDALSFLNTCARDGYIDANQMTMDTTATKAAVMSGRVFCFIGNTADTGFSNVDYWYSPGVMQATDGYKAAVGKSYTTATGWMQTFVSKTCQHPEAVAKLIAFLSSDEGMRLHYYGEEGVDYTLNAEGLVVQTEAGYDKAQKNSAATGVFSLWAFHNISWHDHATAMPTDRIGTDGLGAMEVQCAMMKDPGTLIYDNGALSLPSGYIAAGSDLSNKQLEIDSYSAAQVAKIILAADDAAFESLYAELIQNLDKLGLKEIDAYTNEQVQRQYESLGYTLTAVNGD